MKVSDATITWATLEYYRIPYKYSETENRGRVESSSNNLPFVHVHTEFSTTKFSDRKSQSSVVDSRSIRFSNSK